MINYIEMMQEYYGGRNDGFLTDKPVGVKLPVDAIIQTRYDVQSMQWIHSRPSRIKYPTAEQLIEEYQGRGAERFSF